MRRLSVLLLVATLVAAFGFSEGLEVTVDSMASAFSVTTLGGSFSASPTLAIATRPGSPFIFDFRLSYSASGSYSKDDGVSASLSFPDGIDLQALTIGSTGPRAEEGLTLYKTRIGRYAFSDPSGQIYNYRLDGLGIGFVQAGIGVDLDIGYTGLFWKSGSPINMGYSDLMSTTITGSPRVVGALNLTLPRIFGQGLGLFALAQQDLRAAKEFIPLYSTAMDLEGKGGPVNTHYLGATASGGFGSVTYSLFATLGGGRVLSYLEDSSSDTGYRYLYAPIESLLAGGSVGYSVDQRLGFGLRFQYGTGDKDAATYIEGNSAGKSTQFISVAYASSYMLCTPDPGNMVIGELSASYAPFPRVPIGPRSIQILSKSALFMKTGDGPVSVAGVHSVAKNNMLGLEQDFSAQVKLLSDLSLNASFGVFLPAVATGGDTTKGAFDETYEGSKIQYMLRLGASLSM